MIFTRLGFKALKFSYAVLIAGLSVAGFIVGGSYFYWQAEKKNDQQSQRALLDLRGRLTTAIRDREDLRGSEDTYKMLVNRGVFIAEERFDLIEALAALKARHQLIALSYDIAPQRPLRLATTTYVGVDIVATRIKMTIQALHDADLVAFLDEFPRLQRGFFPLDRCVIKRTADAAAPAVSAAAPAGNSAAAAASPAELAAVAIPARSTLLAKLEAECSVEWVTLRTKGGPTIPAGGAASGAKPS